ncbi:response regulator, partial [Lachnospiraceae bacterium OF09-6]
MGVEMKLLIADDEEFSRTCISEMLDWNSYGITVVATAENGLDAWEKVKKYKPDIVITDIKMPQISGLDLLTKIQENHLEIDTIMISGFDEFAFAQKALNLGAKNYLLKPVNPAELLNSVITLQDQKNQERRNKFDGDKEGNLRNMIYLSYTPEELDEIHDQMLECWDYFQAVLLLQMDNISDALYIGETNIYKILLQ